MPNIGNVLKSEISRVARKELRGESQQLKKTVAQLRSQLVELKRRMQALEQLVKRQARGNRAAAAPAKEAASESASLRFSAKGFAAQRQRLGISAAAMAQLLGVSALSVYKWESGKTRPRAKQLEAIAGLRRLGKREAMARLTEQA
jgi:DNA-binding transcriptional regulator YiaG